MNRRLLSATILAVSSIVAAPAIHAAPMLHSPSLHAMFGKTKMVSFSLRNDTPSPLKVKAGDNVMTIDAGKTLAVKLPAGSSVTAAEATPTLTAGAVIAQVTGDLSGVTIAVK